MKYLSELIYIYRVYYVESISNMQSMSSLISFYDTWDYLWTIFHWMIEIKYFYLIWSSLNQ